MRTPRGYIQSWEVRVVSWHRDRPTFLVNHLRRVAGSTIENDVVDVFVDGREGDVVIKELSVLYLEWRWDTSAFTTIDTRRGDGNGFEPTDLNLGREMAAKKEEGLRNL